MGKQPFAWKEYCAEYLLKDFQENRNRCTGRRDITEIQLITAFNTIQSFNIIKIPGHWLALENACNSVFSL